MRPARGPRGSGRRAGIAAAACVLLGACATVPDLDAPRALPEALAIDGTDHAVTWRLPPGRTIGLALLQPGFTRTCRHLSGLQRALVARDIATLCVENPRAGGGRRLAEALADLLVQGLTLPDGRAAPPRWLVVGHSAGAVVAARLGASLARQAPARLAGAVLLDPVDAPDYAQDLSALSGAGRRPVLTISAAAGPCNAQRRADPAMRALQIERVAAGRDAFVGVQGLTGSTHLDAEGDDTDLLAWAACRQGWPRPAHVQALRVLAVGWAEDLLHATRSADGAHDPGLYPGGARFEAMRAAGLFEPF